MENSYESSFVTLDSTPKGLMFSGGNSVYLSLKFLIEDTKEAQRISGDRHNYLGGGRTVYFYKELATIKVGGCRGIGHSSAIAKYIDNHPNLRYGLMGSSVQDLNTTMNYCSGNKDNISCFSPRCFDRIRGFELDMVFVENPDFISKKNMNMAYSLLTPCLDNTTHPIIALIQ